MFLKFIRVGVVVTDDKIVTVEVVPVDCAPEPAVTATWISTELIVSI